MNSGRLDPVAATEGIDDMDGVGLFITNVAFWSGARAKLASVLMLEADILLAGEAGRPDAALTAAVKGDGDGLKKPAAVPADAEGWRGTAGTVGGPAGAVAAVGVACGVDAAELALALATEMGAGVCLVAAVAVGGW